MSSACFADNKMKYELPGEDCPVTRKIVQTKNEYGRYSCLDCEFRRKSLKLVKRHYDVLHTVTKRFACASCDFEAYFRSTLKYHLRTWHMAEIESPNTVLRSPRLMEITAELDIQTAVSDKPVAKWRRRRKLSLLKCDHCPFTSFRPSWLKKHLDTTLIFHKRIDGVLVYSDSYVCPRCDFSSKNLKSISRHHSFHKAKEEMACSHCEFKTTVHNSFIRHMAAEHTVLKPLKCAHCPYETGRSFTLRRHVRLVHSEERGNQRGRWSFLPQEKDEDGKYRCPKCAFRSAHLQSLKRHFTGLHSDALSYPCSSCEFKAKTRNSLNYHLKSKHSAVRKRCDSCQYTCVTADHLKRHVNAVHWNKQTDKLPTSGISLELDGTYTCTQCDFRSQDIVLVKRHFAATHAEKEKFSCSLCRFKTNDRNDIKTHIVAMHMTRKPFKCDQCVFACRSSRRLKAHVSKRHGRLLECAFASCGFTTRFVASLRRHILYKHTSARAASQQAKELERAGSTEEPVCQPGLGSEAGIPISRSDPGPSAQIPTSPHPISKPSAQIPTSPRPISKPSPQIPTSPHPISKPSAQIPTSPRPISKPSAQIPTSPHPISKPSAQIPTSPHPISKPSAQIPTSPHPISKPSAQIPTSPRPISKPSAQIPTSPHPISKPSAQIPTSPHPISKPSAQIPTSPHPISKPSAQIPTSPRPISKPSAQIPISQMESGPGPSSEIPISSQTDSESEEEIPTTRHEPEHTASDYTDGRYDKNACDYCDYRATSSCNLRKHVIQKHSSFTYQCTRCSYSAPTERQLINHFKARNHFF